jgi:hypothetical protein
MGDILRRVSDGEVLQSVIKGVLSGQSSTMASIDEPSDNLLPLQEVVLS